MDDPEITEDADTARRRDAMLLRVLKTPPQPRPKRDRRKPSQKPVTQASEKRAES